MPRREETFRVAAPPGEVWRFIRDIESLCACIPGVERVKLVDAQTAALTVREKLGIVPLILELTARIDAEEPPQRLRATLKAEHLSMEIEVALRAAGTGTQMTGVLQVQGTGQLKAIVDRVFEKRATERAAQFAATLEQRFGAGAAGRAAPAENGGWLARLWRRLRALVSRPRA
ncbi:MAG: SRPBCC family protein [Burkholderiales bacterium]|nr:SRPBCC family protein [Burkholderiales bacterium]